MNRIARTLIACSLLVAVPACGMGSSSSSQDPYAGLYTVDITKTAAVRGQALTAGPSRANAVLEQRLGPDAYLLDLRPNGTFVLQIDLGRGDPFTVLGSWAPTEGGIVMSTTSAEGQAPVEAEQGTSTLRLEGEWLVVDEGPQATYLRRS